MIAPKPSLNSKILNSDLNKSDSVLEQDELLKSLIKRGLLTIQKLDELKVKALTSGKKVEQILIDEKVIDSKTLAQTKSEVYDIPYIDISDKRVPLEVLNLFSKDIAKRNQAIVFEDSEDFVKVAMEDPLDLQKTRFLTTILGKKVEPYFTDPASIDTFIDTRYGAQISEEVDEALEDVADIVDVSDAGINTFDDISTAPVARIVNMILEYAVKHKASDIHVEPRESGIVVRYRLSGVLYEKLTFPNKLEKSVIARIKILSNLRIDEHRVPQDGRFQVKLEDYIVDVRVSIIPSVYGEKIVLRLLERGSNFIELDNTGIRGKAKQDLLDGLKKTQGIILITGPTGSGKTVTLASSLKILNKPEVNIVTLEDPVEIKVEGITQIQVNNEIGMTFANGLRAILRQDPDIIMVGEIRDQETARLAVQASLTGHLVLATLHTNDSAGAIPRLIDMGVEPFLLSSTINVVGAQRLTRKICEFCKTSYKANDQEVSQIKEKLVDIKGFDFEKMLEETNGEITLYKGKGCPKCGESGYAGRIGIFEVFTSDEEIKKLISSNTTSENFKKTLKEKDMITMVQDGFFKVLEGVTTIEEVLRVVN